MTTRVPNDGVDGTEMAVVLAKKSLVHGVEELDAKFGVTSSGCDIDGLNTTTDENVVGVRGDVGIIDGALVCVGRNALQSLGIEEFDGLVFASSCESHEFGVEADSTAFVVVGERGSDVLLRLNVHDADGAVL